jgi:hypothetical protein
MPLSLRAFCIKETYRCSGLISDYGFVEDAKRVVVAWSAREMGAIDAVKGQMRRPEVWSSGLLCTGASAGENEKKRIDMGKMSYGLSAKVRAIAAFPWNVEIGGGLTMFDDIAI